jgi:hypothetical protein
LFLVMGAAETRRPTVCDVDLITGSVAGTEGHKIASPNVARLFAPGLLVRDKTESYRANFEIFADQRRTRGFDDGEIRPLCHALTRFAAGLIDALRLDDQPMPLHLEGRAKVIAIAHITLGVVHSYRLREQTFLDALCGLIQGWPMFSHWFVRYAAPRICALLEARCQDGDDTWLIHATHPGLVVDALTEDGRMQRFRDWFYNL